jgi:hypothetical protein
VILAALIVVAIGGGFALAHLWRPPSPPDAAAAWTPAAGDTVWGKLDLHGEVTGLRRELIGDELSWFLVRPPDVPPRHLVASTTFTVQGRLDVLGGFIALRESGEEREHGGARYLRYEVLDPVVATPIIDARR